MGQVAKLAKRIFPYHILSNKDEGMREIAGRFVVTQFVFPSSFYP